MSLLIIGSCSKITQNIVLHLGKSQTYSRITISDLLPTYCFHKRYYKLRQQLDQANINTSVALNKLISTDELYKQINNHNDILFITHDYFQTVTSKTKIMELTAEFTKKVNKLAFRKKMLCLQLLSNMIILDLITPHKIILIVSKRLLLPIPTPTSFAQMFKIEANYLPTSIRVKVSLKNN